MESGAGRDGGLCHLLCSCCRLGAKAALLSMLGAQGGRVGTGRGPSATHRSVSPQVRCCQRGLGARGWKPGW